MTNKMLKVFLSIFLFISISEGQQYITLPPPVFEGSMSVEEALLSRRSRRVFTDETLSQKDIGQLLWAAYGISLDKRKFHTVPSAGATFPSEIFAIIRDVSGIASGIYYYVSEGHKLELIEKGDFSKELQKYCLEQTYVGKAQANIIIAADFARTMNHYGSRGEMYVYQESGHIGQNIYLQAEAMNLNTVAIGAFEESNVKELIKTSFRPIYIFPVGCR